MGKAPQGHRRHRQLTRSAARRGRRGADNGARRYLGNAPGGFPAMEITGCFKRGSGGSGRQASSPRRRPRRQKLLAPVITWGKVPLRGHLRGKSETPYVDQGKVRPQIHKSTNPQGHKWACVQINWPETTKPPRRGPRRVRMIAPCVAVIEQISCNEQRQIAV